MIIATSNETVSEFAIPYYLDKLHSLLLVVGLSSSAIGLLGNFTVLGLIFGSKKFRRPANFYVANLSVTSIMYILITNIRFYAGRPQDALNHQLPICLLMAFLGRFTHALIAFTTLTIVVDRNYRVKHPMSVPSKRTLLHFIALIWVGAVCVTAPRIYMFDLKMVSDDAYSENREPPRHEALVSIGENRCLKTIFWNSETAHICYLCIYFLTVTFVPISVAIAGLVKISKVINILHACHRWNKDVSNIRHRILRNTFIFAVLFILCWGPSGVAMFLTDFPPTLMPDVITENFKFFKYFNIVGFVQNSLNPILLFILSSDLREYIYKTKTLVCGHHTDVVKRIGKLLMEMQGEYNGKRVLGMRIEPDLTDFMGRSRQAEKLEKAWIGWNKEIGTGLKPLYIELIRELNAGVKKGGVPSLASVWQDEMGMGDVVKVGKELYEEIRPLYTLLQAYVRFKLGKYYKIRMNSTIPVHLLGLPRLPGSVRHNSRLFLQGGQEERQSCHGTAVNMFRENPSEPGQGDYRILMCAPGKLREDELLTLFHEMGHVYYFMASSSQEPIFQGGAAPAFHEAVGDSISYGYHEIKNRGKGEEGFMRNLLKIALAKIPQIPYGLILDTWRWEVFGSDSPEKWNADWWKLNEKYMGISHPEGYRTEGLDPLGKYHVVQNMPYLRYFFASFLQLQFLESYCPGVDIHSCRLDGNRDAGARLWKMMKKGASIDWRDALEEMTGSREISSKPLIKYFEPLKLWLEKQIKELNIVVGW